MLVQNEFRNYTVKDYDALFTDIGFELGSKLIRNSLPSWTETPPGIPLHCLHGSGRKTPGQLYYGPGDFPDEQPYVKHDDGDGTVNLRSLKGCLKWKNSTKQPLTDREYPGAEHNGILGDDRLIKDVFKIIKTLINEQAILDNTTW